MYTWAEAELEMVKLGDQRLKQCLIQLVERFVERPAMSIPASCRNWAETKTPIVF